MPFENGSLGLNSLCLFEKEKDKRKKKMEPWVHCPSETRKEERHCVSLRFFHPLGTCALFDEKYFPGQIISQDAAKYPQKKVNYDSFVRFRYSTVVWPRVIFRAFRKSMTGKMPWAKFAHSQRPRDIIRRNTTDTFLEQGTVL